MNIGFECYKKYIALKLHFSNDTYNYLQYNKQTKLKSGRFEIRSDRYFFTALAKRYGIDQRLEDFFVANILWKYGEFWIEESLNPECEEIYLDYVKVKNAFNRFFAEDLQILKEHCTKKKISNYMFVTENKYPELLILLQQNIIRIQTVFALNRLRNFLPYWKKKIQDTIIYPEIHRKILKYGSFCDNLDRSSLIKIHNKILCESE